MLLANTSRLSITSYLLVERLPIIPVMNFSTSISIHMHQTIFILTYTAIHTHSLTHSLIHTPQHPDSEAKVSSESHPAHKGATDSERAEAILKDYLEQEIGKVRAEWRGEVQLLQDQVHQLHSLVEQLSGRLEEVERRQNHVSF